MDLISAIKSGRPFRRPSEKHDVYYTHLRPDYTINGDCHFVGADGCRYSVSMLDILADDWEIKPEPREWWVMLTPGGNIVWTFDNLHDAEAEAKKTSGDRTVVHVREVVE